MRAAIGFAEVQSRVAQYIANTNTAYARSGVDGELNLVGTAEIDYADGGEGSALLNSFASDPAVLARQHRPPPVTFERVETGSLGRVVHEDVDGVSRRRSRRGAGPRGPRIRRRRGHHDIVRPPASRR